MTATRPTGRYDRLGADGDNEGVYVRFDPGFGLNVYIGLRHDRRFMGNEDDRFADSRVEFGLSIGGWETLCSLVDEWRSRAALPDVPEPQPVQPATIFRDQVDLSEPEYPAAPVVSKPKDPRCATCGHREGAHNPMGCWDCEAGTAIRHHPFTPKSKGPRTRKARKLRVGDVLADGRVVQGVNRSFDVVTLLCGDDSPPTYSIDARVELAPKVKP